MRGGNTHFILGARLTMPVTADALLVPSVGVIEHGFVDVL